MKKKIQKPFDVEAAKNGAKIETRDGRPVRIICYDRKGTSHPILALVNRRGTEELCFSYNFRGEPLYNGPGEDVLVIVEEIEWTKFNVGDWVFMNTHGSQPWLVIKVTPNYYEIKDSSGNITAKSHHTIDSLFRPWTLKDAKPGNILVSTDGNRPFIFRGLYYDSTPTAYCGIDATDSIYISGGNNLWTAFPVRPATYEERLQLFNKLEEEGYKWDADSLTLSEVQKRWRDDENTEINGYYINDVSRIVFHSGKNACMNYNIFSTKKQIKSALAMARISQIMANDKRFGSPITDEEWDGRTWYCIVRVRKLLIVEARSTYDFLAFHTKDQAELFVDENKDLVKDYYMLG